MIYRVVLTAQAARELEQAAEWWSGNRSPDEARKWYAGISVAIYSLGELPLRFPLADENADFPIELRELHFGISAQPTHRAIFTIVADSVVVLTIRHTAQKSLDPGDIDAKL